MKDFNLWNEFKKTVKPIEKEKYSEEEIVYKPRRHFSWVQSFRLEREPLNFTLDLHGKTLNEAYDILLAFLKKHAYCGTSHVTIITGKGLKQESVLKKNVPLWLESDALKKYVSSVHKILDSRAEYGSFTVYLRK